MDKIDELLTRAVSKIYPSKEELEKVLRSGKKLRLYFGIDPTGDQIHIGHMVALRKLRQWQDLGHHVIFLIGDFTGMVGDPSGKLSERKQLSREEVLNNAKLYKEQAGRVILFDGDNPVEIKYNSEWLGKMSAIEFLKLSHYLTYNQVIERDMFQRRIKQNQDVYMNEFMYPFMQAYDSVAMKVDLEIGGEDQTFNMLMGRKLSRNILKKEKFVMTTPLLVDSTGKKIGKTEGNVIALTSPPDDFYGIIMSLSDDIIINGFNYLTNLPMNEVAQIETKLKSGANPMIYKKKLAFILTAMLNDENAAGEAQRNFESIVQAKEMPQDLLSITVSDAPVALVDFLVSNKLLSSRSVAKRLIEQGGVEVDGEKVTEPRTVIRPRDNMVVKTGKRRFVKIKTQIEF